MNFSKILATTSVGRKGYAEDVLLCWVAKNVKLPRSLIVNLARNNVNLDVLVNPDVDVVKYQYYI